MGKLVCLCGDPGRRETLEGLAALEEGAGNLVLFWGVSTDGGAMLKKIDAADEVIAVNPDGVDAALVRHIAYAKKRGKRVRWLRHPGVEAASLIGFTPQEAPRYTAFNSVRVVKEDGGPLAVTTDRNPRRANVATLGGLVSEVLWWG